MSRPTTTSTEQAVALLKRLHRVNDLVFGDIGAVLAELGLTQSQASMLWALEPSSPPAPMRELARKLHCDPSYISLLGDQLQDAGLVERRPDPTDGRRRILTLTAQGLDAFALLFERIQARSPLFAVLLPDEQNDLAALLGKVEDHLSSPRDGTTPRGVGR